MAGEPARQALLPGDISSFVRHLVVLFFKYQLITQVLHSFCIQYFKITHKKSRKYGLFSVSKVIDFYGTG